MGTVAGLAIMVAIIAAVAVYQNALTKGMRPRQMTTSLTADQLADVFGRKVAGSTWKIVDRDPYVARSPLLGGIRQQIAMTVDDNGDHRVVVVKVIRHVKKVFGGPTKAHTLRMRLNAFTAEVQRLDPAARELAAVTR